MLSELTAVLAHAKGDADRAEYKRLVVEENCLGKPTASTRRLSFQRLTELYALDPRITLFRLLRRLWAMDAGSQPQLAILVALARDPPFAILSAGSPWIEGGRGIRPYCSRGSAQNRHGGTAERQYLGKSGAKLREFLDSSRPLTRTYVQASPAD